MYLKDHIPALKFGAKILPSDLAGMIGLPYVGNVYYVDPNAGNDSFSGNSPDDALATVAVAYGKCTSGKNDVVLINPTGGAGRTTETTAITWAKRFTHLIGNAVPIAQELRAGMNFTGTTGTATGSFTISENGCLFKNICFNGTDDVNVPVTLTGDYNSFINCDFKGAQNSTTSDDAARRCLVMTGAVANYFGGCSFGSDSVPLGDASATIEMTANTSRDIFEDCRFVMFADAQTAVHILTTGAGMQQWVEFKNCSWLCFYANNAQKIDACFNLASLSATANVILTGMHTLFGIDDWEATATTRIFMQKFGETANTLGLAVNPTVS